MKKTIIFALAFMLLSTFALAELQVTNLRYWCDSEGGFLSGPYSKVAFTVKNTGTSTERGLFALEHRGIAVPFSIGLQDKCNPNEPADVYRTYELAPGQSADIELKATEFVLEKNYYPRLVHVDECCTNGYDTFDCHAKEPYGWGYPLNNNQPCIFSAEESIDQCDTNYEAMLYLNRDGKMCRTATCVEASAINSVARCDEYGVCLHGSTQSDVCEDGSTVIVRACNQAVWETTGNKCPEKELPPEPKLMDFIKDNIKIIMGVLLGILALLVIISFIKKKK